MLLYGCLINDPFVMCSVTLGLPANYFAVSSALSILGKTGKGSNNETTWKLEYIIVGGMMVWIIVAFVTGSIFPAALSGNDKGASIQVVGYVCIITITLYYLAPLSALGEIIKNRDAAGLYMPMVIMNMLTSTTWAAYGFIFIGDVVVYAPNMLAMLISAAQVYLKLTYPSIDPTKLQRRMTVDSTTEGSAPEPYRHRAGTITQEILCADGTIGVIEFTEEEAATRQRRSTTVTSIAERVLDVLDIVGPPRLPLDEAADGVFSDPRSRAGSEDSRMKSGVMSPSGGSRSRAGSVNWARRRGASDAVPPSTLPAISEEESGYSYGRSSAMYVTDATGLRDEQGKGGAEASAGNRVDAGVRSDLQAPLLDAQSPSSSFLQSISGFITKSRSRSATTTSKSSAKQEDTQE